MAEVLSIFASGVAVAQVAGTAGGAVIKLKKLWDEVKDVPETIQCLMDQIDCLDPALWEAEQHIAQNELPAMLWNDSAAVRSAEYCRKALSKLTELVDDLAVQISSCRGLSKRLAKVKVVLKKDELRKLERRLETAVRLLQTAQQGNIIAMLKLQPDIIVGRVVAKIDNIASSSTQLLKGPERQFEEQDNVDHARCTLKQTYGTEVIHRRKQNNLQTAPWRKPGVLGGFVYERSSNLLDAGFRPPNWLSGISYAWDINLRKSYDGWNFHFRSYSIRPWNSDVFRFASRGNLEVLKGMFASGEASPFDCDEYGYDVTWYAAGFLQLEIIKFFMDLHIFDESKTYRDGSPAPCYDYNPTSAELLQAILSQVVTQQLEFELESEPFDDICTCSKVSTWALFQIVQPYSCPNHKNTTLRSRLERIRDNCTYEAQVIKFILGQYWDPGNDISETDGPTLIHSLSRSGQLILGQWPSEMVAFLTEVIRKTDNVHHLDETYYGYVKGRVSCTPLVSLVLFSLFWADKRSNMHSHILTNLRRWLGAAKAAGIDLAKFGRKENELLQGAVRGHRGPQHVRGNTSIKFQVYCNSGKRTRQGDRRWKFKSKLLAFKIGPEIEDWDILITEPTDRFAGHFWKMVETPPPTSLVIPGAWADEPEDYDSCDWTSSEEEDDNTECDSSDDED
ncbi:uncharacterized protein JN550_002102 [Neoarthrinium moseri]|uniref:uncharacterized protein n=1 Tax=Neoarthrinium moseri TaxID=1658444 RepID=UPI001FDDBABA|nr:uncharacterized protein JN550_002102 [Neoarthrinium moseri]KAI1875816.1 hypothetical protein JN550_002102 [Neoarthrinium moseri]